MNLRGLRRWWRSLASVSPYDEPELVSLDLETTSLDPKSAEILSIAAVPVRGRQVIFCVPGSTAAVRLALEELILPEASHLIGLLDGAGS